DAAAALIEQGHGLFIEVSPHPVLTVPVESSIEVSGQAGVSVIGSLRRDDGGWERFLVSAGQAFTAGADVDWDRTLPEDARIVDLPTYAFQHTRYWLEPEQLADDVTVDPLDARFWEAVERGDLAALSDDLEIDVADDAQESALGDALPV